jgi:hypothetical protein
MHDIGTSSARPHGGAVLKTRIASLVTLVAFAALTACNSGGSNFTPGSPSSPGGGNPGGNPPPGPVPISSTATQYNDVQYALTVMNGLEIFAGAGGLSNVIGAITNDARFSSAHPLTANGGCSNGTSLTIDAAQQGQQGFDLQGFTDAACTPRNKEFELAGALNYTGSTVTGSAHVTYDTATLQKAGIISLSFNASLGQTAVATVNGSTSNYAGGVTGSLGAQCQIASSVVSCGNFAIVNTPRLKQAFGALIGDNLASQGTLAGATVTPSAQTGGLDSLTSAIASATPFFSISGGTAYPAVTIGPQSAGFVLTDATNVGAVAVIFHSDGSATGTVTRTDTNATVATFTVDKFGLGSITYSDGTQGPIVGYIAL